MAKTARFKERHPAKPELGLEMVEGHSMTEPDKVPRMRDLFERHAMGIKDNVMYEGKFSGDLPDLKNYDPHQVQELLDRANREVDALSELRNSQIVETRKIQHHEDNKKARQAWEKFNKEQNQ